MRSFPKSYDSEYIQVAVDYVSKWVKAMPCHATDAKHARRMFHEVIFPCSGTPRMVISDGGSHLIDKTFRNFRKELGAEDNIATPYPPKPVVKQKHQINKSRIFCKRQYKRWGNHGRQSYPMHCGHIELPTKHHWTCHPIS